MSRSGSVLLMNRAAIPFALSPSTWSFISAISGDTTSVTPSIAQRRKLVAQRLPAPRRHQQQRVPTPQHPPNHSLLLPPKTLKPKMRLQKRMNISLHVHEHTWLLQLSGGNWMVGDCY